MLSLVTHKKAFEERKGRNVAFIKGGKRNNLVTGVAGRKGGGRKWISRWEQHASSIEGGTERGSKNRRKIGKGSKINCWEGKKKRGGNLFYV